MFAGNVTLVIMETIMFINEQYDFDWSEDYEQHLNQPEQGPVDVNVICKCKHCGRNIKHYTGRLWHEVGAKIFPQYCVNFSGYAEQLHEPTELQDSTSFS